MLSTLQSQALRAKAEEAKLKEALRAVAGGVRADALAAQLEKMEGFDAECKEELRLVLEHVGGSKQILDVDDLVRCLAHPEDTGKENPIENVSINLAR